MQIKTLLLLASLFSYNSVSALIDQIDEFDSITLYGDIHLGATDKHKHKTLTNKELVSIHKKQAVDILEQIQESEKDCFVIVEDMFDYQGNDDQIKNFFNKFCVREHIKENNSTCIHFLNNACKRSDIEISNIEYRHNFSYFFYQEEITSLEFLNDLQQTITEIEGYDDGEIANEFYRQNLKKFFKETKKFLKILNKNKDKYYSNIFQQNSKLVDKFKLEYHLLFDLKLLHTILQHKDKQIYVCVGRRHVNDLLEVLKKLGYNHKVQFACHNDPINIQASCA